MTVVHNILNGSTISSNEPKVIEFIPVEEDELFAA